MTTIGEAAREIQNKLTSGERILEYIDNEKLLSSTQYFFDTVVQLFSGEQNSKEWCEWDFWESGIDPFSTLASAIIGKHKNIEEHFREVEVIRQRDKTISNAIGEFHQKILGALEGCVDPGKGGGIDLIVKRPNLKMIAEIKNKWNTTKGDDRSQPYDKLKRELETNYNGYTAYYVTLIPKPKKTKYLVLDKPFVPSRRQAREDIRIIDGKTLYTKLTGQEESLEQLYNVFPKLVAYCLYSYNPELSDMTLIDKADKYFDYLWVHIFVGANRQPPPK